MDLVCSSEVGPTELADESDVEGGKCEQYLSYVVIMWI